jgi:hypothetical protein
MRVIRGMHGDAVVYVFSTTAAARNGFEVAADFDLEGIPFGASVCHFVHIWHSDVAIPAELTDRPLMWRQLKADHPQILAALGAEHEAQLAEGRAKMAAANQPHGAESARTTRPAPRGADGG